MTNQEKFIQIFGIDAWQQTIVFSGLAEQFKEYWTSPYNDKTGHWFVDERPRSDREIICSNCEQPIFRYHKLDFDYRPKYCPNCGAKMKSEVQE